MYQNQINANHIIIDQPPKKYNKYVVSDDWSDMVNDVYHSHNNQNHQIHNQLQNNNNYYINHQNEIFHNQMHNDLYNKMHQHKANNLDNQNRAVFSNQVGRIKQSNEIVPNKNIDKKVDNMSLDELEKLEDNILYSGLNFSIKNSSFCNNSK